MNFSPASAMRLPLAMSARMASIWRICSSSSSSARTSCRSTARTRSASGSQGVVQLHQVAFEVLADEVVGADSGYFSGHGMDVLAASFGEGEWELFVFGEVPFVKEGFPFGEIVDSALGLLRAW